MFCSKCGTQINDDACFCYKCGTAVVQNANKQSYAYEQPNTYQQSNVYQQPAASQPTALYNNVQEKFGVNIVYPDGHNEIGDICITATEIIFYKKSKAVRVAFGFLGSALENGEEKLRINVSDIISGGKTRIGINPYVYQITLRNGGTYKLCVNNPSKLPYLEQRFG
ncbi:MAG: zinc ribbon domain-containing protein [Ruminococcaceae bacterium]|nr:zinc ribbon domain-containing protein [Oscillospiraceae bacterium]